MAGFCAWETRRLLNEYQELKNLIESHKQQCNKPRTNPYFGSANHTRFSHKTNLRDPSTYRSILNPRTGIRILNRQNSFTVGGSSQYKILKKDVVEQKPTVLTNRTISTPTKKINRPQVKASTSTDTKIKLKETPPTQPSTSQLCPEKTHNPSAKLQAVRLSSPRVSQSKYNFVACAASTAPRVKHNGAQNIKQTISVALVPKYSWSSMTRVNNVKRSPQADRRRTNLSSTEKISISKTPVLKTKYKLQKLKNTQVSPARGVSSLKTKYKILKLKNQPGRSVSKSQSPKIVRRVNKYSVKYVPIKSKASPGSSKAKIQHIAKGRQMKNASNLHMRKTTPNLVAIGGIMYKTSLTKLRKKGNLKTNRKSSTQSPIKPATSEFKVGKSMVTVRGVKFLMDSKNRVLFRLRPADGSSRASVGKQNSAGVKTPVRSPIHRETNTHTRLDMRFRLSVNHIRSLANRSINRSINRLTASKKKSEQYCMFYNKFGKCNKREKGICPYIHDPEKVAVCKRFLLGKCTLADCPFAHTLCRSKMPVCSFFLSGRCNNDACVYSHVNVNPKADVCPDFAKGYCSLGEQCKKWHVTFCQQYELNGVCDRGDKCPLKHRKKVELPKPQIPSNSSKRFSTEEDPDLRDGGRDSPKRKRLPSFISLDIDNSALSPDIAREGEAQTLKITPGFLS